MKRPTKRQRFLLEHIGRGTCIVCHVGQTWARWHIFMRYRYSATADRQPSVREGNRLIEKGWVILEIDPGHLTKNLETGERIYHRRARLTLSGLAALEGKVPGSR